ETVPAPADPPPATEAAPAPAETGTQPASANASPVARRVAEREGVDLGQIQGSARGGRITKSDVLSAAGNGAPTAAPSAPAAAPEAPPAAPAPGAQPLRGSAAALARYMDQSRSIPTATSFRTATVTALDQRRK